MRIVHNDEVCEVSADDFWSLRMDTGFDRFIAEGDKQIWSLLSEAEEPAAPTARWRSAAAHSSTSRRIPCRRGCAARSAAAPTSRSR